MAAGRVEQRVERAGRGGDHDEEHERGGPVEARIAEHHDERRGEGAVGVGFEAAPGHDDHDRQQRAHVENEHAHDDLVDCLRQHFTRVLGFGNGDPDEFNHLVGEEHHLEAHEERQPAVGCEGEAVPQVVEAGVPGGADAVRTGDVDGRVMVVDDHHDDGGDDHRHDKRDLDHREPEFRFAERFDGNEVDGGERGEETQLDQPFPGAQFDAEGAEEGDEICADRGDFGHADQHEDEPVRPTGESAPAVAEIPVDEVDEGVLAGIAVHHFADGTHKQEHDRANRDIHEDDARAGERDGLAGAEEQARADGAANGDELHVAVGQPAFHLVALVQAFDGCDAGVVAGLGFSTRRATGRAGDVRAARLSMSGFHAAGLCSVRLRAADVRVALRRGMFRRSHNVLNPTPVRRQRRQHQFVTAGYRERRRLCDD